MLPAKHLRPGSLTSTAPQQAGSLYQEVIRSPAERSSLEEIQGSEQLRGLVPEPEEWSYSPASLAFPEQDAVSSCLPGLTPDGKGFLLSVMYTSHSLVPVLPELCCCAPFNILWTRFRLRTWRTPNKNLSKRQFWISQSFRAGAEFTLGNPGHWVQVRHPQVLGNPPRRLTNKSRIGNTKQVLTPSSEQAFIAHD